MANEASFSSVDDYLVELLHVSDPVMDAVLAANRAAGLPPIDVAPNQGAMLMILARACGARRILEIGTLGGYSTIWLARGLPEDGHVLSLEVSDKHAAVARANVDRAGLGARVEVRVAPASESLAALEADGGEPFDLVFIDADKDGYPGYATAARRLTRPGSLIVLDNVVRDGQVADPSNHRGDVEGVREAMQLLTADPGVEVTAVQTVGRKGWDGFALAYVTAP